MTSTSSIAVSTSTILLDLSSLLRSLGIERLFRGSKASAFNSVESAVVFSLSKSATNPEATILSVEFIGGILSVDSKSRLSSCTIELLSVCSLISEPVNSLTEVEGISVTEFVSSPSKSLRSISKSIFLSLLPRSSTKLVVVPSSVAALIVLSSPSTSPIFPLTPDKFSLPDVPDTSIPRSGVFKSPTLSIAGSRSLFFCPFDMTIAAMMGIPIINGSHHHH